MPRDRKGQAVEPTKSARLDQLPSGLGSGAGLVGGALAAGVGHASTDRPDPSTLGAVGERGSHHEGPLVGPSSAACDESCSAFGLLERHALAAVDP
jgi:hypothetical protein